MAGPTSSGEMHLSNPAAARCTSPPASSGSPMPSSWPPPRISRNGCSRYSPRPALRSRDLDARTRTAIDAAWALLIRVAPQLEIGA